MTFVEAPPSTAMPRPASLPLLPKYVEYRSVVPEGFSFVTKASEPSAFSACAGFASGKLSDDVDPVM